MQSPDSNFSVLLAAYNGALFLDEQLASIHDQEGIGEIDVFASDDGSTDQTRSVLDRWEKRWTRGRFLVTAGPRRGFAENFRFLAQNGAVRPGYVAFSDQDDVWDRDKLACGVKSLDGQPAARPSLYFSRTRLVDIAGHPIGYSPNFRRPPDFHNAIVQSIGGGNTAILNSPGFELFAESARRTPFVTHDWWAYLLLTGADGFVYYDAVPHIAYRQHASNLVGRNTGFLAQASRLRRLWRGQLATWMDQNLAALEKCADLLTPRALEMVDSIKQIRAMRGLPAVAALRRSGAYRQTAAGDASLVIAAMIGKM